MMTRSQSEIQRQKLIEDQKLSANINYLKSYIGTSKIRYQFIVDYLRMRNLNKEREIIVNWGRDFILKNEK
jgi:hypothetical protein